MKIRLIAGCIFAAMLSSCSTISHTTSTANVDTEIYNLTVADMKVSKEKTSKTTEWKWNPLSSVSLSEQKKTAEAELLKEADADVLVEPRYEVKRKGLFRGGTVTVSGYPAKYENFRSMTKDDAEVMATLDGKIGVACNYIATSNTPKGLKWFPFPGKKSDKAPAVRKKKNAPGSRSFAALIGGPMFDSEDYYFSTGMQLGAMYGRYGSKWGWYAKLVWQRATETDEIISYYRYNHEKDTRNGVVITVGAIKPISRHFNFLFGAGLGTGFSGNGESYGYERIDTNFAVPVELGFQWSANKMTVLAGCTGQFVTGDTRNVNIAPFVGIGYCF